MELDTNTLIRGLPTWVEMKLSIGLCFIPATDFAASCFRSPLLALLAFATSKKQQHIGKLPFVSYKNKVYPGETAAP